MKNYLLIAATALLAIGASAQEVVEEPVWTVEVNCTEPADVAGITTYSMTATGIQKGGFDIYATTVTLPDANLFKPAKYWITVKYQLGDESLDNSKNNKSILVQPGAGDLKITISALRNTKGLQLTFSNNSYGVGDSNYRLLAHFPASTNGENTSQYFNAPLGRNEFKCGGNISSGTDFYLAAASVSTVSFSRNKIDTGIYKATLDYTSATFEIEDANSMDIAIDGLRTFVAPADVTIPDGVSAYTLEYNAEEPETLAATKIEDEKVAANTPVILKAEPGVYTFPLDLPPFYILDNEGKTPTFILDSESDNNVLIGVHQPHYLPEACYRLDGDNFEQWKAEDNTDSKGIVSHINISQFSSYVKLPDDATEAPATLAIKFPKNNGGTTGIENVAADQTDSRAYNLMGIPVDESYKGIVIRAGKKHIQR